MKAEPSRAMDESTESAALADLRARLEREADAIDAVIAARLAAARHRALAAQSERPGARGLPWFGTALAASLLLAVVLGRGPRDPTPAVPHAVVATSNVQAAGQEPPKALIESDVAVIADIEFYDWLEAQDAIL